MNFKFRYRLTNNFRRTWERIIHPWPIYKKVGGVSAVINKADGTKIDLGTISDTYVLRRGYTVGNKSE